MQLAFRLASSGTLFSKAIAWWTNGTYCHAEVWFDRVPRPTDAEHALCFSSMQGEGTRFKTIDLRDPKQWMVVNLPVTGAQELAAYQTATSLVGLKYDWLDIAAFLFPPIDHARADLKHQPKRFICSAVCTYLCQQCGLFKGNPPGETSPDLLANLALAL